MQEGISWLKRDESQGHLASILVLLTDGEHNSGSFAFHQIVARLLANRSAHTKVYGLAFGDGADFSLLRQMSAKTGAFARKIYEAADAAIQLDSFYAEISSPLLADTRIK